MWSRADLGVLKGIDVMRRRPEMYMPEGVSASNISARIVSDALVLGARHVRLDVKEAWQIVSADVDWLTRPAALNLPVADLFQRLIVLHEGGPNAARAEAWVGAYCQCAYSATATERLRVVGDASLPVEVELALLPAGCVRSIAFRMT
jgi:hypothetical protein